MLFPILSPLSPYLFLLLRWNWTPSPPTSIPMPDCLTLFIECCFCSVVFLSSVLAIAKFLYLGLKNFKMLMFPIALSYLHNLFLNNFAVFPNNSRWASARRTGMTVLGKVAVPKPLNLPSQRYFLLRCFLSFVGLLGLLSEVCAFNNVSRLEHHGLDPNVEIVPK